MNDTDIISEQATIRSMVRGASHQPNDEAVLDDLDLVIESLAQQGEYEEAGRLRKAHATSKRFSAFDVSNAILDILDDGHIVDGLRYGWKFDYYDEDRANEERLDFRDLVLARLQKGGGK